MELGALYQALAEQERQKALNPDRGVLYNLAEQFQRDPAYEYGSILPFRKATGGSPEWGFGYSNLLKSVYDAVTAPRRAYQGALTEDDAMNFALTMGGGGVLAGKAPGGALGMNVYHGSPHKFEKFDMSKVGTGEGAQAYGHGLYFAENPQVAKSYNTPLREAQAWIIDGQRANGMTTRQDASPLNYAANALERFDGNIKEAAAWAKEGGKQYPGWANAAKILNSAKSVSRDAGHLYKVDLPDSAIAKMLDWDKPLSQQPEAYKALQKFNEEYGLFYDLNPTTTGKQAYQQAESYAASISAPGVKRNVSEDVSQLLRKYGIPGIKYLDQGSRSGGKGTSNFVVFDDQLPKIIGRE